MYSLETLAVPLYGPGRRVRRSCHCPRLEEPPFSIDDLRVHPPTLILCQRQVELAVARVTPRN